ncbi:fasciclin domain-containing protein [Methanoregula sp.]|uniref:fasciclin domain-containing protein n=1 Tax=Methanoregula sp. TaxID=2052170 RepID=UPI002CE113C7|nr:fasciclin domain-containing protein [Methanoregula sp.]HVP95715.1 fasciclin domain-containing protein [Methanoregula sp.]
MPGPAPAIISEILAADSRFSIMTQALRATGLDAVLAGKGPYTVCAPTDEAFRQLPPATLAALMVDPRGELFRVLQYHILFGNLPCNTIKKLNFPKTRLGITVEITEKDGKVLFGGAAVTIPDIACTNGVILGISRVVIPVSPGHPGRTDNNL